VTFSTLKRSVFSVGLVQGECLSFRGETHISSSDDLDHRPHEFALNYRTHTRRSHKFEIVTNDGPTSRCMASLQVEHERCHISGFVTLCEADSTHMIRGLRIPCKAQGGSEQNEFRPWCSNFVQRKN
jgi:hypothetical protein